MGHRFIAFSVLLTQLMFSSTAGNAGSGNGFFGVGLTVLAAKPITPNSIIIRNATYTPGAVAIGLSAQGYAQVSLVGRNASGYIFSAVSRSNGQRYLFTVASWRGEIISAVRG